MKPRHSIRRILAGPAFALALLSLVTGSQAATQYGAGTFTWDDASTPAWSSVTGGPYTSTWTAGNDAVLEGTAAGTVSIGAANATAHNITATITGYTIQNGILTLNGTAPTVNLSVGSAGTAISGTIKSVIAGGAGLTKLGAGTLTLNSPTVNTFTGGLILNGGTVTADYATLGSTPNLIDSGNTLGLGGGILTVKGRGATYTCGQQLGDVTVNAGGGQILGNNNSSTSTTITLGNITATTAGGSLITGVNTQTTTTGLTITTSSNKDATTGIYGGRHVWFNGTANTGYDWTTSSGSGPYTLAGLASGSYTTLPTTATSSTVNYNLTAGGATLTPGQSDTVNSLKLAPTASGQILGLGSTLMTINSGGLLCTGTNAVSVTGDVTTATKLTAGNYGSGAYDLIVHQYNTGGLTISAVIGNNGSNSVSLTKNGSGTLTLSPSASPANPNTYTGGTYVNAGTLTIGTLTALQGTGTVTVQSGATVTASINGGLNLANNLTLNGGTLTIGFNGTPPIWSGPVTVTANSIINGVGSGSALSPRGNISGNISGTGGLTKTGTDASMFTGTNNTYSGPTAVKQGLLMVQYSLYGNDPSKWTPANITVASGATLGLNVGGTVSGNNEFTTTQAATFFGNLTSVNNNGLLAGSSICISTANASGGVTYSANITDSTGTGGGLVGLKKIGANTLELTGTNTYTGQTILDAGTLKVSSFNSVNSGSPPLASSSLGRPITVANGTIEIGKSSFGGGNIVYTGGGETTDRVINVAGQSATLVLDQSGPGAGSSTGNNTGLLKFSSPFTLQTAAKTLTLQGSTAGTGELSAAIPDPSGTTKLTLTKSGTGTWTLSNTNTYTGNTKISGGALQAVNGTGLPSGSYLQLDGGVLQGSGSFTRVNSTTVNGANFQWLSANGGGFSANGGKMTVTINNNPATEQVWGTAVGNDKIWGTLKFGSLTANAETEFQNHLDLIGGTRTIDVATGLGGDFATISGVIRTSTGTGNITKTGTGTLKLSNTNTYNGTTAVNVGTLLVNGTNSGTGLTTVASAATLGGTGRLAGAATFSSGAKAVFTITRNPLTGANTTPLTIDGVMTYNATEVHINAPANLPSGTYTLATSLATPAGTVASTPVLDTGTYASGFTSAVVSLVDNNLILTVNGLPTSPTALAITSINGGASPTNGLAFSVVVQAVDANGLARSVTLGTTVTLSLNTGTPGSLGGNLVGIITAGTYSATISGVLYSTAESGVSITATASGGDTLTPVNSSTFTVIPDTTPASLTVSGFPTTQTAGVAGDVIVTARTPGGSVATSYVGTVHFTSNDSQAVLPPDFTFQASDLGTHTFSGEVTLKTAGTTLFITATDTVTSSITGTESPITVVPAAAATLTVSGFPSPQAQDVAGSVTVTLKDAYDNLATNYTGTVHFTSASEPTASLPGDYQFVSLDQGAHNFIDGVTFATLGTNQSITATDTANSSVTGTQSGITVWVPPTSFTWANAAGGNWSVPTNWQQYQSVSYAPITAGEADYILNFGAGTYTATHNLSDGFLVNQLNFSGAVTLGGTNAIALTGTSPAINQNSASAVLVLTPLTFAADVTVGGTGTGGMNLFKPISGSGNLIVDGAGTLTLTDVNSYGATIVSSNRTLQMGSAGATFGAGPVTVNSGATMAFNGNGNITNTILLDTAKVTNGNSFSANLNGPITLTGISSIDLATTGNMSIGGIIDGMGGLTKLGSGQGPLNLNNANSYYGATTITAGSIKLGAAGSINNTSDISIAAGATFDVSAKTSPYGWSTSTSVTAKGTGTLVDTSAARILTATSGVVNLGSQSINLTFAPTGIAGDVTHPSLLVTPGALTLNNNTFTVTNTGSPLGAGVYRLIQVGDGATGVINENASPAYTVTVSGNSLVTGNTATVSVSSGNVIMTVTSDPYEPWIAYYFPTPNDPNAAKDADPDNDGHNNLEEFALNSIPNSGVASGKVRSRIVTVGSDSMLVLTLPVRGTAPAPVFAPPFSGSPTLTANIDHVLYTIEGSNDLTMFDRVVTEITAETDMPVALDAGWSYRSFQLDGVVGGTNPHGFMRVVVEATP